MYLKLTKMNLKNQSKPAVMAAANFVIVLFLMLFAAGNSAEAQVANYTFTQSVAGFTPIVGNILYSDPWDDDTTAEIALPFVFNYNFIPYNSIHVNTNGFISLGGSATVVQAQCGLRSGMFYSIAGYSTDLESATANSTISWDTTGIAPNRKFIVQWTDCDHWNDNQANHFSFQIVLCEGTDKVQVIWGASTIGTTSYKNVNCTDNGNEGGHVGLIGGTITDFNIRSVTNGANTWSSSITAGNIDSVCTSNVSNVPGIGLTYTWTPPPPPPMTYVSSTTTFLNNSSVDPIGSTTNQILQIKIVTTGVTAPFDVTSLALSTAGCTNPAVDIANVKVYFTGFNSTFSTTTQFGTTVSNPNGPYTVNGTATMYSGANYFWVTYDVSNAAGINDLLRGCCNSIVGTGLMGTQTPTVTCPIGSQSIDSLYGNWTPITALAPDYNGGVMILLSDGTVIAKTSSGGGDGVGSIWDRLTPDIHGSYVNGTWSQIDSMFDTRLYFSSQMMKDGRVYVAGGEYGTGGGRGEIYDPVTNSWTALPNIGHTISDANSAILPNGNILQAMVTFDSSWNLAATKVYNQVTNSYGPVILAHGVHNESMWVKLPDGSILYIDRDQLTSERFIPSLNQWVVDGALPDSLYDIYGSESGTGFLLPNGKAFFIGATSHTAYYTPSGNSSPGVWTAGPDLPNASAQPDAAGAMMVNGKIIIAVSPLPTGPDHFPPPTSFYIFDYLTNSYHLIRTYNGGYSLGISSYITNMLVLPNGSILYSQQQQANSNRYYQFTPSGSPLLAGKPTINNIVQTTCDSFMITGTMFNGITGGAAYGDDSQNESNYPLVRITNGTNVYYCRTYNWNRTDVMTGALPDTTYFTIPAGLPHGTYSLVVVANGNPSDTMQFIPFPIMTSTATPPSVCSGTTYTYTPTAIPSGVTFTWTRAAVTGISNSAITIPQAAPVNETLVNTTSNAITVVYIYTLTSGGCSDTASVSVVVNAEPSPVITASLPIPFCDGEIGTLNAGNFIAYDWSSSATTATIPVASSGTYTVTVTDANGCIGTASQTVAVNPLPVVSFTGLPDSICHNGGNRTLTGNHTGGTFAGSGITGTIFNPATAATGIDTIRYSFTDSIGCTNSSWQIVNVLLCLDVPNADNLSNTISIYPNPATNHVSILFLSDKKENYTLRLLDVTGRIIINNRGTARVGENKIEISLTDISKGIYLLLLEKADTVIQSKMVVE